MFLNVKVLTEKQKLCFWTPPTNKQSAVLAFKNLNLKI